MTARDAIRRSLGMGDYVMKLYLGDLGDDDLKVSPIPGLNPIALQLGHLIEAERMFHEMVRPGAAPALPEGFSRDHDLKAEDKGDASRYRTKAEYLALWDEQRHALMVTLDSLTDADLDAPNPMGWEMAPTIGDVLVLNGGHLAAHAGQFVAVRRHLGKPIVF